MHTQTIGGSARLFTNALTIILSTFAAWGWCAEVRTWPPQVSDFGVIAMAAITLTTQQLANAMAARAFFALQRGAWMSAAAGIVLSLTFAGATAFGVDHAFMASQAMMRAEAAESIDAELRAAAADAREANARLLNLPTDIPASRLVVLQGPMRTALEAAEAREADARARYAAAIAPSANETPFRQIFEVLSFCEIGLYWVLAASQSQPPHIKSQSRSQSPGPSQSQTSPPRVSRGGRPMPGVGLLRGVLSGAALAWSMAAPGAARPMPLPRATTYVVGAAPPPTRVPSSCVPQSRSVPNAANPRVLRAIKTGRGAARPAGTAPTPVWLDAARALRVSGLSFRAIAARIGVPKSTVFRWLTSE
jgi:hypothetical protein